MIKWIKRSYEEAAVTGSINLSLCWGMKLGWQVITWFETSLTIIHGEAALEYLLKYPGAVTAAAGGEAAPWPVIVSAVPADLVGLAWRCRHRPASRPPLTRAAPAPPAANHKPPSRHLQPITAGSGLVAAPPEPSAARRGTCAAVRGCAARGRAPIAPTPGPRPELGWRQPSAV